MKIIDAKVDIPYQNNVEKLIKRCNFWFPIFEFFGFVWDYELRTHPLTKETTIEMSFPQWFSKAVATVLIGGLPNKDNCHET